MYGGRSATASCCESARTRALEPACLLIAQTPSRTGYAANAARLATFRALVRLQVAEIRRRLALRIQADPKGVERWQSGRRKLGARRPVNAAEPAAVPTRSAG